MTWIISKALMEAYENSHCSQEQAVESSAGNCSDGERFAPLNVMPTPHPFWLRDKTMDILSHSRFSAMSASLPAYLGEAVLTWFQGDSLARTSQPPGRAQESKVAEADCGERWLALSMKFDPDTFTLKTHRSLFQEDLELSSVTLPKWGMMCDGELWELATWAHPTSENESGSGASWPTPCAQMSERKTVNGENVSKTTGQKFGLSLIQAVKLWPTPVVQDYKRRGPNSSQQGLVDVVQKTWATPQARDYRTGGADRWDDPNRTRNLNDQAAATENGGQLNPDWVEWLMGWPIGWTRLEPISMDWRGWDVDPADEPGDTPRVASGIGNRVDRLRAIGNGQVPAAMATAWEILSQ